MLLLCKNGCEINLPTLSICISHVQTHTFILKNRNTKKEKQNTDIIFKRREELK